MWWLIREEVDSVHAVSLAYAPNQSTSLPARSKLVCYGIGNNDFPPGCFKLVCDGIGEIDFLRPAWGRVVGSIFQSRSLPQPEDRHPPEFARSPRPPNRTTGQSAGRRRHSRDNESRAAPPAP